MTHMLWKSDIPKSGWSLEEVVDTGKYAENQCEWCGTDLRYVHILRHKNHASLTEAGCICAEYLTGDPECRIREKALRSRASKISTWAKSPKWQRSKYEPTQIYRWDKRYRTTITRTPLGKFTIKVRDTIGKKEYATELEAKIASYDALQWVKKKPSS